MTPLDADEFVLEVGDDGRGVDSDAVRAKARQRGLPCSDASELTEALFADGFSTKAGANELSGRGVGLGAVRATCVALGGRVQVHTRAGAGTRLEFRFPRAAMRAALPLRAAG